jgi:hypothetical protein
VASTLSTVEDERREQVLASIGNRRPPRFRPERGTPREFVDLVLREDGTLNQVCRVRLPEGLAERLAEAWMAAGGTDGCRIELVRPA